MACNSETAGCRAKKRSKDWDSGTQYMWHTFDRVVVNFILGSFGDFVSKLGCKHVCNDRIAVSAVVKQSIKIPGPLVKIFAPMHKRTFKPRCEPPESYRISRRAHTDNDSINCRAHGRDEGRPGSSKTECNNHNQRDNGRDDLMK